MRSLVILSPRSDEEQSIIEQWKNRSKYCEVVSSGRVTLDTGDDHIFIDFTTSESDYSEYEDEGVDFDVRQFKLYFVSFSSLDFLKKFLRETNFTQNSLFDNDHFQIVSYDELFLDNGFFDPYSWGLDSKDVEKAHLYCSANEALLSESSLCGCFYCLKVFPSHKITSWINDQDGKTALCPYCQVDSILPGNKVDISQEFLGEMHKRWFGEYHEIDSDIE